MMHTNTGLPHAARVQMPPEVLMDKVREFSRDHYRTENVFHNAAIDGVTLENSSLRTAEFHFAAISNTRFCGMEISGAEFLYTEFHNVEFVRCSMSNCQFDFSRFDNVTFQECQLDSSIFGFISGKAVFHSCQLQCVKFPASSAELELQFCNAVLAEFNDCPALNIQAHNCNFHRSEFNDGIIRGAFRDCQITHAEFKGSNTDEVTFVDCRMRNTELRRASGRSQAENDDSLDDIFADADDDIFSQDQKFEKEEFPEEI